MKPFPRDHYIMGIVNVTPDSFYDGGVFQDHHKAIDHARQLLKDGADIIDIGGESTRPGADPVSVEDELNRVLPVIRALKDEAEWISVDTRHAEVMEEALKDGANFINDVSALEGEGSLEVAAKYNVPVCLMHKRGQPKTMQQDIAYNDVVSDIYDYLRDRIETCLKAGIDRHNLIIDPGIGFGKTLDHNIALFQQLDCFHDLNCPILIGASRKTFIGQIMGQDTPPQDRLGGSLAAALFALTQNVKFFRVHDVRETKQAITVFQTLMNK